MGSVYIGYNVFCASCHHEKINALLCIIMMATTKTKIHSLPLTCTAICAFRLFWLLSCFGEIALKMFAFSSIYIMEQDSTLSVVFKVPEGAIWKAQQKSCLLTEIMTRLLKIIHVLVSSFMEERRKKCASLWHYISMDFVVMMLLRSFMIVNILASTMLSLRSEAVAKTKTKRLALLLTSLLVNELIPTVSAGWSSQLETHPSTTSAWLRDTTSVISCSRALILSLASACPVARTHASTSTSSPRCLRKSVSVTIPKRDTHTDILWDLKGFNDAKSWVLCVSFLSQCVRWSCTLMRHSLTASTLWTTSWWCTTRQTIPIVGGHKKTTPHSFLF